MIVVMMSCASAPCSITALPSPAAVTIRSDATADCVCANFAHDLATVPELHAMATTVALTLSAERDSAANVVLATKVSAIRRIDFMTR